MGQFMAIVEGEAAVALALLGESDSEKLRLESSATIEQSSNDGPLEECSSELAE
jgi:hypothetical protein